MVLVALQLRHFYAAAYRKKSKEKRTLVNVLIQYIQKELHSF